MKIKNDQLIFLRICKLFLFGLIYFFNSCVVLTDSNKMNLSNIDKNKITPNIKVIAFNPLKTIIKEKKYKDEIFANGNGLLAFYYMTNNYYTIAIIDINKKIILKEEAPFFRGMYSKLSDLSSVYSYLNKMNFKKCELIALKDNHGFLSIDPPLYYNPALTFAFEEYGIKRYSAKFEILKAGNFQELYEIVSDIQKKYLFEEIFFNKKYKQYFSYFKSIPEVKKYAEEMEIKLKQEQDIAKAKEEAKLEAERENLQLIKMKKAISDSIEIVRLAKQDSINDALKKKYKITNSQLVKSNNLKFDYSNQYYLLPDNIEKYEFLNNYTNTAFNFACYINEARLKNLTIKELKQNGFKVNNGMTYVCFDEIKGFEDMSKQIKTYDEFTLLDKKKEIIDILVRCLTNYKKDYSSFIKGINGTYSFSYVDRVGNQYNKVLKSQYDFDNKKIILSIIPNIYETQQNYSNSWVWEEFYSMKYNKKYKKIFPNELEIDISIENAKKLFKDGECAWAETIITVIPKNEAISENMEYVPLIPDFDIVSITKRFYKSDSWSEKCKMYIGEPVLILKLESDKKHPFY